MNMKAILTTVALTAVAVIVGLIVYNKFVADRINFLEADETSYPG